MIMKTSLLLHDRPYWPNGPVEQIDYQSIESLEVLYQARCKWVEAHPDDPYFKGARDIVASLIRDCYHGMNYGSSPSSTTKLPELP